MNTLPKDPVILLSFINTQLRDNYSSLKELCNAFCIDDAGEIINKLAAIQYTYDSQLNQFI
ncbi:MAG: DUF4250 domain-containing protein [Lachnospiraceae bacterium]